MRIQGIVPELRIAQYKFASCCFRDASNIPKGTNRRDLNFCTPLFPSIHASPYIPPESILQQNVCSDRMQIIQSNQAHFKTFMNDNTHERSVVAYRARQF